VQATVSNWNPATLSSPDDCVLSPTNESVENICTLYGYDAAGNQITTTNTLSQTSLTVYDAANRPVISVANWDGTPIASEADCAFPPLQADTNLCTVTYYDPSTGSGQARGQRSASKDPMGNETEYGYDALGRVITTTRWLDGVPVVSVNHYDALGNRITHTATSPLNQGRYTRSLLLPPFSGNDRGTRAIMTDTTS
jgi:YD repeat-containing protein